MITAALRARKRPREEADVPGVPGVELPPAKLPPAPAAAAAAAAGTPARALPAVPRGVLVDPFVKASPEAAHLRACLADLRPAARVRRRQRALFPRLGAGQRHGGDGAAPAGSRGRGGAARPGAAPASRRAGRQRGLRRRASRVRPAACALPLSAAELAVRGDWAACA